MKRIVTLCLCATSLTLAAEVLVRHPDDCRKAFDRIVKSLPRHVTSHKPVHRDHPPTAATVKAWHAWDASHRKIAKEKLDFACSVETEPTSTSQVLPISPLEDVTPSIQPILIATAPDEAPIVPYGLYPSETLPGTDTGGSEGYPVIEGGFGAPPSSGPPGVTPPPVTPPPVVPPPIVPPPVAPVPEPATLVLFGTGLLSLVALRKRIVR